MTSKRLAENDVKNDIKASKRHTDVMNESRLNPPCKMTFPCTGQSHANPVEYASNWNSRSKPPTLDERLLHRLMTISGFEPGPQRWQVGVLLLSFLGFFTKLYKQNVQCNPFAYLWLLQ